MPTELIKSFIDKKCTISLVNDTIQIIGIIKAVETYWILIQEEDSSRLVNGAFVRDIKIIADASSTESDDVISPMDTAALITRIKELSKPSNIEIAKYIGMIWRNKLYQEKYRSLEDFGARELSWDKSKIHTYKDIGDSFFDSEWNPLLPNLEEWGIGKLRILATWPIHRIRSLQEHNFIDPNMTEKDLRNRINSISAHLEEA